MFSFLFRWERGAWKVLVFGNLAVTHLVGSFVSTSKPLTLHADSYSVLWHKIRVKEWSVREEEEVPFNSCPTFTSQVCSVRTLLPVPSETNVLAGEVRNQAVESWVKSEQTLEVTISHVRLEFRGFNRWICSLSLIFQCNPNSLVEDSLVFTCF